MKLKVILIIILCSLISCKKANEALDSQVQNIVLPAKTETNESKSKVSGKLDQKIIKEGNLRFETSDLDRTYNQIITNTKKANGTVQNDTEGKDYGTVYRKLIVRIPSQNFDVFIQNISKGVAYFDN